MYKSPAIDPEVIVQIPQCPMQNSIPSSVTDEEFLLESWIGTQPCPVTFEVGTCERASQFEVDSGEFPSFQGWV